MGTRCRARRRWWWRVTRLHVVVRGRVQGVGFRWHVRERARSLGLSGRVRNRPDGSVEVEAEGSVEALESLREVLRDGPPGAQVRDLEEIGGDTEQLPSPFTIVR